MRRELAAVLTIDAMENVPPEDWPLVLANLHRAARPGGVLNITVEEVAGPVIDQAFQTLTARGLPAVRGEAVDGDVAGYHYYPGPDRVASWFGAEGLQILDEGFTQEDGWVTATSCSAPPHHDRQGCQRMNAWLPISCRRPRQRSCQQDACRGRDAGQTQDHPRGRRGRTRRHGRDGDINESGHDGLHSAAAGWRDPGLVP